MGAGVKYRTLIKGGPEYPPLLTEAPGAPSKLFAAGQRLESAPYLAIVGSRRPSRYGLEVTRRLAAQLAAAGVVVVSGMARGIDSAAHEGALEASGTTIAVLGSGIDICYPARNRRLYGRILSHGTLLTEYELGTQPMPYYFPARNRIIAGMSLGVLITEGVVGGGAMITARLALEAGREVFALGGPVHSPQSEGPHSLIRDGARLITSAADVLDDLGLDRVNRSQLEFPEKVAVSPDEAAIIRALEAEPQLLEVIAQSAGMPFSAAASVLARLELRGLVVRHAGRFALSVDTARK
jgi:DNA processing protein